MDTTDTHCRSRAGRPRCPGKEAAILDAALTLLAQQGFTRMTLDQVARTAGVSKATVHLRWKTKTALAAAALTTLRPCGTPSAAGDPYSDLIEQLDDFAHALVRNGGMALAGTCLAEEAHTPVLLELLRQHAVEPRRATLRLAIERARRQGALRDGPDPDALVSALLGTFYADCLAGRTGTKDWAARTVAAVLGLLASPAGSSPGPAPADGRVQEPV